MGKYYSEMDTDQFLGYVEIHSKTQRALFHKTQVAEMLFLAGYLAHAIKYNEGIKEWYSLDMCDLVEEARKRPVLN